MTMDLSIGVPGATLTLLYLVQELALIGYMLRRKVRISLSYALLFAGLGLFLVLRTATWCLWMTTSDSMADTVMNRLAWLCGGLVLVVLLASWMDAVHSQFPHGTPRFLFWLKFGMAAFAVAYGLALLIPTILLGALRSGGSLEDWTRSFDASMWVHLTVQFLLSLAFLGYGITIFVLLRRRAPAKLRERVIALIVAVAVAFAYVSQLAVFLVRPAGGCLPLRVFWAIGYILPCALTSTVVLFLIVQYARSEVMAKERVQHLSSQAPLLETPAMYENI
jgi:hypothetical protein